MLLSALAEGADRLAARVALELGARLVVPMPMPRPLYEDDFNTPSSRDEFADLVDRSSGLVHLPLLPGVTEQDIREPGHARDQEYAKVGAYIARHSQVFVAFWDGAAERADTTGGTAQTVGFRLRGVPAPYAVPHHALVFATTPGPVVHIETPRESNPASAPLSCAARIVHPDDLVHDSVNRICERIDLFNADAREHRQHLRDREGESAAQLLNTDRQSVPSSLKALPVSCRRIADQYAVADGLALHFGAETRSTWKWVTLGVMATAIAFHLHAASFELHHEDPSSFAAGLASLPWFLIAFLALSTFTATWVYGRAEKREYQTKYQDYRALAEALRIQFFWRVAGVDDPVVEHYLRKQHSELEWIRSALKSCDVLTSAAEPSSADDRTSPVESFHLVTTWIEDQRRYFASKARSEEEKLRKEARTVGWFLKLSGGLAVVLAFLLALPLLSTVVPLAPLRELRLGHVPYEVLMVVVPLLAVGAGLLDGYGRLLARAEHVRQFTRMSDLFSAADRELERLHAQGLQAEATALIRDLGIEALDENGDWLILHRERPLEVPPG